MKHVLSTHLIVNHRLTSVWLEKIWNAGIPQVELFCAKPHLDYEDHGQIAELGHWFRDAELKVWSMHGPLFTDDVWGRSGPHAILTIAEPVKSKRIRMVDEIKRALEIAETIPCRYFIQHIGVPEDEFDERNLEAAFTALEELNLFAGQRNVEILVENIPNRLSTSERLMEFVHATHLDLGFCFDVGHAHIMEGIEPAFHRLKDRIRSTHVHDNDGHTDQHLFPLVMPGGTVDWNETMPLLRSAGEEVPLLLELKQKVEEPHPIEAACAVFQKLEEMA
jgi:sugar phosphate isomerase/epimerase